MTEAEKKLETELAYINKTNVTLLAKRADLEAKQASAEEEVSEAQARYDNLTAIENKTRDQETQLKMEKVIAAVCFTLGGGWGAMGAGM